MGYWRFHEIQKKIMREKISWVLIINRLKTLNIGLNPLFIHGYDLDQTMIDKKMVP